MDLFRQHQIRKEQALLKDLTKTHYRTCHLCEAMCGLEISTLKGEVLSIRGDEKDVYSKGHICPKAVALQDIHADPNRLRQPMRRTENGWEAISWEEALQEAGDQIIRIQKEHGRDAVGIYTGNPTVHNTGTILYLYDFMNAVGTRNRFASHSLDQLPQMFMNGEMFGHQAMFTVPDLERTKYFLIIGANPLVSNGSIMSTPDIRQKLEDLQARGGKVVVIDPRKTLTAKAADEHLAIIPGTDVLLLLALVHTFFAEKLFPQNKLNRQPFIHGYQELEQLVLPYSPETVAVNCGISAQDIRLLAREFSQAKSAICYGRLGVSTQAYGTLCQWLILCLNILSGNLDRAGGVMFTKPAIDFLSLLKHEAKALRWKSRVRGLPEVAGDLPATTLADEILTPGEGQIKCLVTVAGNPVLSTPNGPKLDRALGQLDYMIAIDLYLNETTRHANLILPPATGLEVIHYDFVLAIVAIRNMANFSPAVFPKKANMRYDWEILYALQKRLEKEKMGFWAGFKHLIFDYLTPERRLDLALRIGPYGVWGGRFGQINGLSLAALKKRPHGIDLGALEPRLPGRLFTKDKKINLVPANIVKDLPRVQDLMQAESKDPDTLLLFGRRQLNSNNSWFHNYARLMKKGDTCLAQIHPNDATKHGIVDEQVVTIRSKTGEIKIRVDLCEDILPGTISIPHGWGHGMEGTQLDLANQFPGVNVNILTDDLEVEGLTGNAVFQGIPVQIISDTTANQI